MANVESELFFSVYQIKGSCIFLTFVVVVFTLPFFYDEREKRVPWDSTGPLPSILSMCWTEHEPTRVLYVTKNLSVTKTETLRPLLEFVCHCQSFLVSHPLVRPTIQRSFEWTWTGQRLKSPVVGPSCRDTVVFKQVSTRSPVSNPQFLRVLRSNPT